ncbi:MAG: hypothetical protein ACRDI2_20705, partial [Chloroflexota bacterium]
MILASHTEPRRSRATRAAALAVLVAAALPYISTLDSYFLGDDFGLVQLFSQKSSWHVLSLFTTSWTERIYGGWYDELRPLVALSYQLDSLWGASSPFGYHLSSITFHVLNALLVFAIARMVCGLGALASAFAGVVFAVLPVHAETVAWISGRADSIPSAFYLASFLAYVLWRRTGDAWRYGLCVGAFFLALFSKQSAITMLATLVLYDVVVTRRSLRPSWPVLRDYAPIALLTTLYLLQRYALFGNFVRERDLAANTPIVFAYMQFTHLQIFLFGSRVIRGQYLGPLLAWMAVGSALAAAIVVGALRLARRPAPSFLRLRMRNAWRWASDSLGRFLGDEPYSIRRLVLFFGPAWWLVSTAPLVVTYVSARHLYLAGAGVALTLGLGFNALWLARQRPWRPLGALLGAGLVLICVLRLLPAVGEWNAAAAVSEKITRDVGQVARTAPRGSLLVLGAPDQGVRGIGPTWLWGYALPFAVQPPFSQTDLSERAY